MLLQLQTAGAERRTASLHLELIGFSEQQLYSVLSYLGQEDKQGRGGEGGKREKKEE